MKRIVFHALYSNRFNWFTVMFCSRYTIHSVFKIPNFLTLVCKQFASLWWWFKGAIIVYTHTVFHQYNYFLLPFFWVLTALSLTVTTSCYTLQTSKSIISYPKNICKKGEAKKVQVTERPKGVISMWGQEEKLYQLGCI